MGVVPELVFIAVLIVAALIDARERRLSNALALALGVLGAVCAGVAGGAHRLAADFLAAVIICSLLVVFEIVWRRRRGAAGQGMGDIKALGALALVDPASAVVAYAAALILLAVACVALKRPSLPLLPFIAVTFVLCRALVVFGIAL